MRGNCQRSGLQVPESSETQLAKCLNLTHLFAVIKKSLSAVIPRASYTYPSVSSINDLLPPSSHTMAILQKYTLYVAMTRLRIIDPVPIPTALLAISIYSLTFILQHANALLVLSATLYKR